MRFHVSFIKSRLILLSPIRKMSRNRQNEFYFERSPILNGLSESGPNYRQLYENIPVAMVLGWAGAQDQHVRKYEQIYSKLGYHTIRFSPSNQLTFFQHSLHKSYADRLLDLIDQNKLKNNTYITHFFSNASCFIAYQYMLKEKEWEFFRSNQKSAIFDSAPGLTVKPLELITGISDLIKPQLPIAPLRYLTATGLVALLSVYYAVNRGDNYFSRALSVLAADQRPVPALFFYSTKDKLISSERIASFIEIKRSQRIWVESRVFNDCDHVLIYPKYPDEYVDKIKSHLEHCKCEITQQPNFIKSKL